MAPPKPRAPANSNVLSNMRSPTRRNARNQPEGTALSIADRYEQFQKDAVGSIVADFEEKPAGRFLLVIPTGGGKTFTAVKAVSALYDKGILAPEDRTLWVAHREELISQAGNTFRLFAETNAKPDLPGRIDLVMLSKVAKYLQQNPTTKVAVVDEAHHGAAASYQKLFQYPSLGILGLTATPSRHDGAPLQFDRESYSIGFPDLVEMGVLLRPEVIRVEGGTYDLSDIGIDSESLEILNNDERNARIVAALLKHKDKLHKVLVYVGTRKHAEDLFDLLKASPLAKDYESVGLILGGVRRRYLPANNVELQEARKDFIDAMKGSRRSLLVNVDVLTEGYDDPSVNAVVMARPTNSKLVYMQAMGRAVRLDPDNRDKQAFVLEVVDELPNIRYRIDNRWLFSDISDALEPAVVDVTYPGFHALPGALESLFDKYSVPAGLRGLPPISSRDRVTVLLFKFYVGQGVFQHIPIVVTNDTRPAAANFFNFLSSRMDALDGLSFEHVLAAVRVSVDRFPSLAIPQNWKNVLGAMENGWAIVSEKATEGVQGGQPWVTFVSLRLRAPAESLSADLLAFTEDMVNRDWVRETLRLRSFSDGFFLARLPLPLKGSFGAILPPKEFEAIQETVEKLRLHMSELDAFAQWKSVIDILGGATLPVESRHHYSLVTVVREGLDYFRQLSR